MERCAERSGKENVKGRLSLGELEVKRKPFFLPLYSTTTRSPTLENRIQGTTIMVVQFYIT